MRLSSLFGFAASRTAILLLASAGSMPCAARADMAVARTSIREVHLLDPREASQQEPVHLTGVVTALSGWKNSFFLQDAGSGISVDRRDVLPELHPGDLVVVDGATDKGSFATIVLENSVRIVGHAPMPMRRLFSSADLALGVQDSQWIAVQGEVRAVERRRIWDRNVLVLMLNIGAPDLVTVHVHDDDGADHSALVGANITVQGVCGTVFNDRRQFTGLRVFANSFADIQMDRPAPDDPYDFPFRNIVGLLQFSLASGAMGEVKVQGTAIWSSAHQGFYVQDSSGGTFVEDRSTDVPVGAEIVAVGYPSLDHGSAALHATHVRVMGRADPPPPAIHDAGDLIVARDGFIAAPYDSLLVAVTGKLVEYVPGVHEDTLLLESGTHVFSAKLPAKVEHPAWQTGSVLRLTGVCMVISDERHEAVGFSIGLRSADDVEVVHAAPWWTTAHALWLSGALASLALLLLGWNALLRRQASLRTLVATDPLTGLYNRRGFLLLAQKQLELSLRRGGSFLLFYIDLDRFKQINDQYGHRVGDVALRDVAAILHEAFRDTDLIGRLGGDEFAVLAVDATERFQPLLETRLAEALHSHNEHTASPVQLHLSTGVLCCDSNSAEHSMDDLLARADALMYRNKRSNRMAEAVPAAA